MNRDNDNATSVIAHSIAAQTETSSASDELDTDASETESPEEIRARIEQTRAELSDTISALQEKLDPERLKERAREEVHEQVHAAKESVREATLGKAEKFMHDATETVNSIARPVVETVSEKASQIAETVGEAARPKVEAVSEAAHTAADSVSHAAHTAADTVRDAGSAVKTSGTSLLETIRQNPIPAALAAIGIGWLVMSHQQSSGTSQTSNYRFDSQSSNFDGQYSGNGTSNTPLAAAQEKVGSVVDSAHGKFGDAMETAHETAGHLSEQARHTAHRAQEGLQHSLHDTPFAVGIVALAIGAALGMTVPTTPAEQNLMGETRDKLVDQAQHAAQDTLQKVQHVAGRVVEEVGKSAGEVGIAAKSAAQEEGLTGSTSNFSEPAI